jgi:hypothetical protein
MSDFVSSNANKIGQGMFEMLLIYSYAISTMSSVEP